MEDVIKQIQQAIKGEVHVDEETRNRYKRDASIYEMMPQVVIFPENVEDIKKIVTIVAENKKQYPELSVAVRAAGTCMSGGSLTKEILIVVEKLNKIIDFSGDTVTLQPGVYYRDLEKELNKRDLIYPSYPSSKRLCAVGGMVANNCGGEKSLLYGKTENYVEKLKVILADGNEYEIKKLTAKEMERKMNKNDFEGKFYKKLYILLTKNKDLIEQSSVDVSKNSTGYNIWSVMDEDAFDIPKLFVGSQGTLGIITEITLKLVKKKKHHGMLVLKMSTFDALPEIVQTVLKYNPASFESYDHYTLRLAMRYYKDFAKILKISTFETMKRFYPEFIYNLKNGVPNMVLLVEFESNDLHEIHENLKRLAKELSIYKDVTIKIARNQKERDLYWSIRRESFNLLRRRVKGVWAAPYIDDTCVKPEVLPEFLPEMYKIIDEYKLQATIAGHVGNGNFHIIPLVDLTDESERKKILKVMDRVFEIVFKYGGTSSGEHNDGLVRAPYLKQMYGEKVYHLFEQVKEIFDPQGIINPNKKIGVSKEYTYPLMITKHEEEKILLHS